MNVWLVFEPIRTREFTWTLLDYANDLFLPCASLDAVACTGVEADAISNRIIAQLMAEIEAPEGVDRTTHAYQVWEQHLETLCSAAVRDFEMPLEGSWTLEDPPGAVHVVLRPTLVRAWTRVRYDTFLPDRVFADADSAKRAAADAAAGNLGNYVITAKPLLGVDDLREVEVLTRARLDLH